jgi:hypothetical protein
MMISRAVFFGRNFSRVHFAVPLLHAVGLVLYSEARDGSLKLRNEHAKNRIKTPRLTICQILDHLLSPESVEDLPSCT